MNNDMDKYMIENCVKNLKEKGTKGISKNNLVKMIFGLLGYIIAVWVLKSDSVLLLFVLTMNIYCMTKSRNNNILFIINFFLLFSNYSIYAYYFSSRNTWGLNYGYYWFMQFPAVLRSGAKVVYLFTLIIFSFYPNVRETRSNKALLCRRDKRTKIIAYVFIVGIILISSWSILTRIIKGYFPTSTIYEYMSILFILGYYHTSNDIKLKKLISCLLFINVIHVLTSGDRMPAVQFMMIYYANFMRNRFTKKELLLIFVIGIVGLNAVGIWRGMYQFNIGVFADSIKHLFDSGLTLDTAFAAEAAGLGMIKFASDCSWADRLYLFCVYVAYIFLGARAMGRNANLSLLAEDAYPHFQGGGVLPNYGYFYLGTLGVILLALLVSYYFHIIANVDEESKGYHKCLAVQIFITSMSWYLYSPSPLIRGVLLMTVLYYLSEKISMKGFIGTKIVWDNKEMYYIRDNMK